MQGISSKMFMAMMWMMWCLAGLGMGAAVEASPIHSAVEADTYVRAGTPDTSYGNADVAVMRGYDRDNFERQFNYVPLMKFDLDDLPASGDDVASSVLQLRAQFVRGSVATPIRIYRVLTPWDESATYSKPTASASGWADGSGLSADDLAADPAATYTIPAGVTSEPAGYHIEIDITDLVRGWVNGDYDNHGLLIVADVPTDGDWQANFFTREGSDTVPPNLRSNLVPEPATGMLLPAGAALLLFRARSASQASRRKGA